VRAAGFEPAILQGKPTPDWPRMPIPPRSQICSPLRRVAAATYQGSYHNTPYFISRSQFWRLFDCGAAAILISSKIKTAVPIVG